MELFIKELLQPKSRRQTDWDESPQLEGTLREAPDSSLAGAPTDLEAKDKWPCLYLFSAWLPMCPAMTGDEMGPWRQHWEGKHWGPLGGLKSSSEAL